MTVGSSRHEAVAAELGEWWEDVRDGGVGSRVVLVQVPDGWGAPAIMEEFRGLVEDPDGPVTILVSVDGVALGGGAVEAGALRIGGKILDRSAGTPSTCSRQTRRCTATASSAASSAANPG